MEYRKWAKSRDSRLTITVLSRSTYRKLRRDSCTGVTSLRIIRSGTQVCSGCTSRGLKILIKGRVRLKRFIGQSLTRGTLPEILGQNNEASSRQQTYAALD